MTSVLGPTSIRVTFSASNAESYDIQYTRVVGTDQLLCTDVPGDAMTASDVASPYDITNLEEFSSYDITVTAVFPGSTVIPTTERATTSPAGVINCLYYDYGLIFVISCTVPAAAPRDLVSITVLSTSITVGWNAVACIERNGVIDNYIVWFGVEGGVQSNLTVDTTRTHSISGLSPSTRYSVSVAAMNSVGTGPFTATLIVETSGIVVTFKTSLHHCLHVYIIILFHWFYSPESTHWSDGCSRWSHQYPCHLDCTSLRLLCHHWLPHHLHQDWWQWPTECNCYRI